MGFIHFPKCKRKDCRYEHNGKCTILNSSNFKGQECPFFKEKEDDYESKNPSS